MSFAPKCLCLDIETAADDALDVRKIAAWRPDTHGHVVVPNVAKARNIAEQLDALTEGASFVVGHNLLRHDIPLLRQRFPQLRLLALPIVDTLEPPTFWVPPLCFVVGWRGYPPPGGNLLGLA